MCAPIPDFHLASKAVLENTLAFLKKADQVHEAVVVHCAGGRGRTGHLLAAWLVFGRGFSIDEAVAAVKSMGRNPYEAVEAGNATVAELHGLLAASAAMRRVAQNSQAEGHSHIKT